MYTVGRSAGNYCPVSVNLVRPQRPDLLRSYGPDSMRHAVLGCPTESGPYRSEARRCLNEFGPRSWNDQAPGPSAKPKPAPEWVLGLDIKAALRIVLGA
jgi:hypothetical protein